MSKFKLKTVSLEACDIMPSKIVCVGRNYVAHVRELGNDLAEKMVVFLKPNSSISENLLSVHAGEDLHYEGELCFMIKNGRYSAIGFGLDLTKRTLQNRLKEKGLPWERAKGFNGAALFSKFVELPGTLENISFELEINNKPTQSGNIELMIYKPAEILDEISSFMTLYDGDIVMTGTPKGVGRVISGDTFDASIRNSGKVVVNAQWCAN